jgi:hypothetical protein
LHADSLLVRDNAWILELAWGTVDRVGQIVGRNRRSSLRRNAVNWFKSTYSGSSGDCVEVAVPDSDAVLIRDSKDPDGPRLTFDRAAWAAFIAETKAGKNDI